MEKTSKSSDKWILFSALLWAVTYMACLGIAKEMNPPKTVGIIVAFLPTITFSLFIYNFIKALKTMDEVEIRIQLEAAVWAFTLSLLLLMTLGLLDLVIKLKKEDWSYRHLIPMLFCFYFFGIIISRRKYN